MTYDELSPLGERYRDVLASLFEQEPQPGEDGEAHPIDATTRVSVEEGMTLHALCVAGGATSLLEVGLAYGFSTVFLLAALEKAGGGTPVSIDPYQATDWHGIGAGHARRLVSGSPVLSPGSFSWVEERSERALVDLEREGRRNDLTFVDGYHRFDDVLVDFTLAARSCRPGGVIVLHDRWLESVEGVVSFVRENRGDFEEVPTACENLGVFRRTGEDLRDWKHFVPFPRR